MPTDEKEAARLVSQGSRSRRSQRHGALCLLRRARTGGVEQSFGEAFVWYKKAAEAGQPAAMTRWASCSETRKCSSAQSISGTRPP